MNGGLRSLRDHAWFRIRLRARLALEIAMASAGLVLIGFGGTQTTDWIGATMSVVSAGLLLRDIRASRREDGNVRIVDNPDFAAVIDSARFPPGFARPTEGDRYITSAAVNATLDTAVTPLRLMPQPYALPRQLADHIARCVDLVRPEYNETKVGLRGDPEPAALARGDALAVQKTDYFSGLTTNERAADQFDFLDDLRTGRPPLDCAVVDLVVEGGVLIDLADSTLSNHIGVTTLLLTSDHRIVRQEQGRQVVSPLELSVGASGSVDFADLIVGGGVPGRTLQDMLRAAMEREAREEVSAAIGPERARTVLTGYARYLDRGGKPEFFGITRTRSALGQLRAPAGERKHVHRIYGEPFEPTPDGLIAAIDRLLDEAATARRKHSLSMTVCLRLAREHVTRAGIDLAGF